MIILEFRPNELELQPDFQLEPWAQDPAVVEETYFVVPIRFAIGTAEMLGVSGTPSHPWRPLPLLGFASALCSSTRALAIRDSQELYLAGGGWIHLSRTPTDVQLRSTLNGSQAQTDYSALHAAVATFTEGAQRYLLARCARMATHPHWLRWWRG